MSVRINQAFSDPLPVCGGCPQGSLLGVFLFNISVDDVEMTPDCFLQETDDCIRVGDLFDEEDREFLRVSEDPPVLADTGTTREVFGATDHPLGDPWQFQEGAPASQPTSPPQLSGRWMTLPRHPTRG